MKVMMVAGAYTFLVHYRYLCAGDEGRLDYSVLGVSQRMPDGTRRQLSEDLAKIVAERYQGKLEEALFDYAEAPDQFNEWAKQNPVPTDDAGKVSFEDCMAMVKRAYEAPRRYVE